MISRRRLLGMMATAALPVRLPAATADGALSLESELLRQRVAAGKLPELSQRLPRNPRVIDLGAMGREPGQHGGTLRMLIGGQRDIRYVPING